VLTRAERKLYPLRLSSCSREPNLSLFKPSGYCKELELESFYGARAGACIQRAEPRSEAWFKPGTYWPGLAALPGRLFFHTYEYQ
jgi:hypothetical protein